MSEVNNIWVFDLQTKIYSKVKAILNSKLRETYPTLFITDDDEVPKEPQFPSIYVHFLTPLERGQDLEGKSINAIYLTAEVIVTTTKVQGMKVCRDISAEALNVFKNMSFQATLPSFENDGTGTKRMIARYSRVVGYDDVI